MKIICFTPIDSRHRWTRNTKQIIAGAEWGPASGLIICEDNDAEGGFFLFGCDPDWELVTDTWHQTIEQAKAQAEFEYEGVSETWETPA